MRIESPGTWSTDDAFAECDTNLELIVVSYFTLSRKVRPDAHGFSQLERALQCGLDAQRFTLRVRSSLV